jgi:hypothetical protein
MQELEEDPDLRGRVNLYREPGAAGVAAGAAAGAAAGGAAAGGAAGGAAAADDSDDDGEGLPQAREGDGRGGRRLWALHLWDLLPPPEPSNPLPLYPLMQTSTRKPSTLPIVSQAHAPSSTPNPKNLENPKQVPLDELLDDLEAMGLDSGGDEEDDGEDGGDGDGDAEMAG